MDTLHKLLLQLQTYIPLYEKRNATISNSSIGWQIEHSLLTINLIVDALAASNTNEYKFKFKPMKYLIRLTGKIPRGKAKAPKRVQPQSEATADNLQKYINNAFQNIEKLSHLNSRHFFPHPYFGNLKLKEAKWFLNLHTKHHLAIIEDIAKS